MTARALAAASAEVLFETLPQLTWTTFSWLLRKGIPARALIYPEMPRRARVVFAGSFFDFDQEVEGEGVDALIFLACDKISESLDLVAWSPSRRLVAAHWGAAHMLGAESILLPRLTDKDALPVHRDPLGWLRAERFGVVMIDRPKAAIELRDFGPLAAEDVDHGRELRGLFHQYLPQVYVPGERRAAA